MNGEIIGMKKLFLMCMLIMVGTLIPFSTALGASTTIVPVMDSNTTPSGQAFASYENLTSNQRAFKAFNGISEYQDSTSYQGWGSGSNSGFVGYEFESATVVNGYGIYSGWINGNISTAPKNWTFEGWDGTTWVTLDSRNNETVWTYNVKNEYLFNNSNAYLKYRLNITDNNGSSGYDVNLMVNELEMYGTSVSIPNAPTNLTAISGVSEVTLSWDAVTEAGSYNVKRATTQSGPYTTLSTVTGTTYSDLTAVTGTTYYYVVSAVNAGGESANSSEAAITYNSTLSLNVESLVSTVQGLEEFTLDVKLKNASDIYAEDLTVTYDTTLFELVSSNVGSAGLAFYNKDETTAGQLRYIVASQGEEYGINTDTAILKLTFKAKNVAGTGTFGISSGLVADSVGNEFTPELFGTDITVELSGADVNNDGKFSLGDLSIAAFDYLQLAANVSDPDSDVDKDTKVNDTDLNLIVDAILTGV
jgi:hypothetical protein